MNKQKFDVNDQNSSSLMIENKKLSKEYKRQVKFTIVSVFFVTIIMISSAFAIFSDVQRQESDNTLTVGKLKIDFVDTEEGMGNIINLNGAYPVSDTDGASTSPYIFKITNSGTLDANYVVKIVDDQNVIDEDGCSANLLSKDKIRVSVNNGTPFTLEDKAANSYIIDEGSLLTSASKTYEIRIWISDQSGNEILGKHYHGKIVVDSQNIATNDNILEAYTYNETLTEAGTPTCVNGEESTCVATKCYEIRAANSCPQGTVIKYQVNANESHYFYVLHDDGQTMTLQQRENTVRNIAWHAGENNNSYGPDTILPALENATTTWTNVNILNYEPGVTQLNGNAGTQCLVDSEYKITCNNNPYTSSTLGIRNNVRARMITAIEASDTGCLAYNEIDSSNSGSCPDFMHNYLYSSSQVGGSYEDNTINELNDQYNWAYWTMSAVSNSNAFAWNIDYDGVMQKSNSAIISRGARAVIQINK